MNGSFQTVNINILDRPVGSATANANIVGLPIGNLQPNANIVELPNTSQTFDANVIALPNNFSTYHLNAIVILDGPLWASTWNGEGEWSPGLIYNGNQFVRYRIWDGNNWQISVGHVTD